MLAPGRKIHHGAWGGHFAFSGNAWQRLQSFWRKVFILSETMSVVLARPCPIPDLCRLAYIR
jgi:hypothetical protein